MLNWKYGLAIGVMMAAIALGQQVYAADDALPPSVLPNRPAGSGKGVDLGTPFESPADGIELRPPVDSKVLRRQGVGDLVVEFVHDKNDWLIRVSKVEVTLAKPLGDIKEGVDTRIGMLEETADEFQRLNAGAKELRKEVLRVGDLEVGMLAYRFTQGRQQGMARRFLQEALIPMEQREKSQNMSKFYYAITMFSPARKDDGQNGVDAKEKLAADTFASMIESVKLLDRLSIRKDQEDRLKRTRELFLTLQDSKRMQKVAVAEQWLRITRDGTDIGYSYVTEDTRTHQDATNGTLITVASHTTPMPTLTVDVISRIYLSQDWRKESWTHSVLAVDTKAGSQTSAELGFSDFHQQWYQDLTDVKDPARPPVTRRSSRRLEVRTQTARAVSRPYTIEELRPWYLPQVAKQMLPRLLPLNEAKTYMFDTYVSDLSKVMVRYVDVGAPLPVTFAGKRVVAVQVKDRVGMEGAPTIYYMTIDGTYLGSETVVSDADGKKQTYQVISTDAATLRKIWPKAQFVKPEEQDMPKMPVRKTPAE